MLDVLVNKSYRIPDYILLLDTIHRQKLPATLYEAGSYNHKSINHYVRIGNSYFETDCNCIKTIAASYQTIV
jgi:hypothetical protein